MMEFLASIQDSGFSTWLKESQSVWPYDIFCLSAHAIGMAFVVGVSATVALRILGFAPRLPLAPMEGLFPLMYAGFWVNAISGAGLFIAYPVKAATNPGFYLKLTGVVLAVACIRRIRRQVFGNPVSLATGLVPMNGKILAGALLFIWVVTITAGRLMAYHGIANVERQASLAVFIVTVAIVLARYAATRLLGTRLLDSSKPSQADV